VYKVIWQKATSPADLLFIAAVNGFAWMSDVELMYKELRVWSLDHESPPPFHPSKASWSVQPFWQGSPFYLHLQNAMIYSAFQWARHPQNCRFPWGTSSHVIHGFGPTLVSPQMASRSIQPYMQGSQTWQTDRHTNTDRLRYSVCRNKHWMHVMRPKNNRTEIYWQ